jgi:hypothetical protein
VYRCCSQGEITPRHGSSATLGGSSFPEEGSSSSIHSTFQLVSPEAHHALIEADNPFAETFPPRDLRGVVHDPDDLSLLNSPSLSAFLGDEPRSASLPSHPWRIPPALARKHSLPHLGYEGSPLRWSYSSIGRNERAALEQSNAFLPTQHRLSVSSVSLESLNPRACVTPRPSPSSSSAVASDSPISASNLRMLSSHQAARILKAEVGSVDAYVN